MKRFLLYILLIIPFLSSCVSDDCSDCADMAYDTRVKLQVTWPNELSPTKAPDDPELQIIDFTLFVFNANGIYIVRAYSKTASKSEKLSIYN